MGTELREIRSRLRMSQAALSKEVGVTANTLARWERGESSIPASADQVLRRLVDERTIASAVSWAQAVERDPHHKAILEALNRRLDPEVFEACAADLLAKDWPALVPIRGGSDDGFDGAVGDSVGDPFPLITTSSSRVKDNLRRNVKRALEGGWTITRAIFATSRRITPAVRKTLFTVARDLRVHLIQVYDQDWFANALYRESAWCRRLLGITGRPSALSVFPATRRPMLGDRVIGRETEIQRLRDFDRDCVVIGGPGAGKTFVLRALALEGRALFLVDQDREAIADAIREQRPPAVIVDDAHVDSQQLVSLAQLRLEIGAEFRIIAVTWPAESKVVISALHLANADVVDLELIDADTMVKIIKSAGVYGPDVLLRSIVKQAEGRPGLAATLAHLCLRGDVNDVVSGEALASQLGQILDSDSSRLLGAFGLGGKPGVHPDVVATFLGMPRHRVSSSLARLAAAGIVRESWDGAISVWPSSLRWVLVRNAFFSGPGSLPLQPLIHQVPSYGAVETLIGARSRGASVHELEALLEDQQSPDLWSEYASMGPQESDYVMRTHPELALEVARAVLVHAPESILPLLFERSKRDERALASPLGHSLQQIEDWVVGASPGKDDVLYRRQTLMRCAKKWWQRSRASDIAIRVMCIALAPGFKFSTTDPGKGSTVTLRSGILRAQELTEIGKLWPTLLEVARASETVPWTDLFAVVHDWLYPHLPVVLPDNVRELMRSFASNILSDLAEVSRNHPGVQHRLAEIAHQAGMELDTQLDADFEILYPQDDHSGEVDRLEEWAGAAGRLAQDWASTSFDEITSRIVWIESEAELAGINYPRETVVLCHKLAQHVTDPVILAGKLMDCEVSADLVMPFIKMSTDNDDQRWLETLRRCIAGDRYRWSAISVLVTTPHPPTELLRSCLQHAKDFAKTIEVCVVRGEVPETTLQLLFECDVPEVALAAAVGHWNAARRGMAAGELSASWRRVIAESHTDAMRSTNTSYWIGKILSEDADLARDWLMAQLSKEDGAISYEGKKIAEAAIPSLTRPQKTELLAHVRAGFGSGRVIRRLIGDDLGLYGELLAVERLSRYHLDPLEGPPEQGWSERAILALDAGYTPKDIADATLLSSWGWSGSESKMWNQWTNNFEELKSHADPRIARIGELAAEVTSARRDRALEKERAEDVYGI